MLGAWGAGPFDNDTAADWAWGAEDWTSWDAVRLALLAPRVPSDADGVDVELIRVAAAEAVAHGLGNPTQSDPYTDPIEEFVYRIGPPPADFAATAVDALRDLIASESPARFELGTVDGWLLATEAIVRACSPGYQRPAANAIDLIRERGGVVLGIGEYSTFSPASSARIGAPDRADKHPTYATLALRMLFDWPTIYAQVVEQGGTREDVDRQGLRIWDSFEIHYVAANGRVYDTVDPDLDVPDALWEADGVYPPTAEVTANIACEVPARAYSGGAWKITNLVGDSLYIAEDLHP